MEVEQTLYRGRWDGTTKGRRGEARTRFVASVCGGVRRVRGWCPVGHRNRHPTDALFCVLCASVPLCFKILSPVFQNPASTPRTTEPTKRPPNPCDTFSRAMRWPHRALSQRYPQALPAWFGLWSPGLRKDRRRYPIRFDTRHCQAVQPP